jgi:hypothetical protein
MPRMARVRIGAVAGLMLGAFVTGTKVGAFCWYGCDAPPCGIFITECGIVHEPPVDVFWDPECAVNTAACERGYCYRKGRLLGGPDCLDCGSGLGEYRRCAAIWV